MDLRIFERHCFCLPNELLKAVGYLHKCLQLAWICTTVLADTSQLQSSINSIQNLMPQYTEVKISGQLMHHIDSSSPISSAYTSMLKFLFFLKKLANVTESISKLREHIITLAREFNTFQRDEREEIFFVWDPIQIIDMLTMTVSVAGTNCPSFEYKLLLLCRIIRWIRLNELEQVTSCRKLHSFVQSILNLTADNAVIKTIEKFMHYTDSSVVSPAGFSSLLQVLLFVKKLANVIELISKLQEHIITLDQVFNIFERRREIICFWDPMLIIDTLNMANFASFEYSLLSLYRIIRVNRLKLLEETTIVGLTNFKNKLNEFTQGILLLNKTAPDYKIFLCSYVNSCAAILAEIILKDCWN